MKALLKQCVPPLVVAIANILSPTVQARPTPSVSFTVAVPSAPAQMTIYELTATSAPVDFLNEILAADKLPAVQLENKTLVSRGTTGEDPRDRLRAYADPVSGDTHFIPNFAELVASESSHPGQTAVISLARAQSTARAELTDPRFIPSDVTELRVGEPITVMEGAASHAQGAGAATTEAKTAGHAILTIVPATRFVDGLQVYGLGSRAVVSLANDGSTVGALRRWRTASVGRQISPSVTAEHVRDDIERQLLPQVSGNGGRATVDKIELAYYDANAKYLQPVYRFEATVKSPKQRVSNGRIQGFVPIGPELEPIPDLAAMTASTGPMPKDPKENPSEAASMDANSLVTAAPALSGITLGEYVNRDTTNGAYIDMSNHFLSGLTFLDSIIPGWTPTVTRTQYYYAYPWQVNGPWSRYYLNAVNVAYVVPHGDWLLNTTYSDYADLWYVNNIGTNGNPGFGAAAGGVLATWVIMSCEVVPSMYDRQIEAGASDNPYTAFNAWWPVFQGLHNVIGFRTQMLYPDDSLQFGFGEDASVGGDINAAWFQEVAAYDGNDPLYHDSHLIGNPLVHYDRASTMIDGRNLGQSIFNVAGQSASYNLHNFWMYN